MPQLQAVFMSQLVLWLGTFPALGSAFKGTHGAPQGCAALSLSLHPASHPAAFSPVRRFDTTARTRADADSRRMCGSIQCALGAVCVGEACVCSEGLEGDGYNHCVACVDGFGDQMHGDPPPGTATAPTPTRTHSSRTHEHTRAPHSPLSTDEDSLPPPHLTSPNPLHTHTHTPPPDPRAPPAHAMQPPFPPLTPPPLTQPLSPLPQPWRPCGRPAASGRPARSP